MAGQQFKYFSHVKGAVVVIEKGLSKYTLYYFEQFKIEKHWKRHRGPRARLFGIRDLLYLKVGIRDFCTAKSEDAVLMIQDWKYEQDAGYRKSSGLQHWGKICMGLDGGIKEPCWRSWTQSLRSSNFLSFSKKNYLYMKRIFYSFTLVPRVTRGFLYVQHLYTCSFLNFKYSPEDNMFLLSKKSLWKKNTDAL